MSQAHAMWAIIRKDLAIWWRSPATIAITIIPAFVLIIVLVLQATAVTGSPVAIVNEDPGGVAAKKLQNIAQQFDGFYSAPVMTPAQAAKAYQDLQIAAVLTIPKDFSADVQRGQKPKLIWQVRNFSDDTSNDLRRALPDVIGQFLHSGAVGKDQVQVTIDEYDMHQNDASFVAFNLVAVLVVLLLQAGLVNAGLAAVREWESGSVKELLLSPAAPLTIIIAKVIAGVITCDLAGGVTVAIALFAGIFPLVSPVDLALTLILMSLIGWLGAGLGVIFGATLRITERVSVLSVTVAFYLFYLAGGITDVSYLPHWLQFIAGFVPNTYAMDALRNVLLYSLPGAIGWDLVVLVVASVIVMAVGVPTMRRGLAH